MICANLAIAITITSVFVAIFWAVRMTGQSPLGRSKVGFTATHQVDLRRSSIRESLCDLLITSPYGVAFCRQALEIGARSRFHRLATFLRLFPSGRGRALPRGCFVQLKLRTPHVCHDQRVRRRGFERRAAATSVIQSCGITLIQS